MSESLRTFGAIMIKIEATKAKGKEDRILHDLLTVSSNKNSDCISRKTKCDCRCKILGVVSTVGFFDYMILLQTNSIKEIEGFVIHCIRSGMLGQYITETQTIAGVIHFPKDLPFKR